MKKAWKVFLTIVTALLAIVLVACGQGTASKDNKEAELKKIDFILDWTPNTNHTGLYVAKEKGYFKEAGVDVDLKLPPEESSSDLVINGKAPFAIYFQDYMAKKYDTKAHSEVLEAVQSGHIKPGRTLDLGCGHGRNALYLASLGHDVTAVDVNNEATQRIQMIADEENYNVRAGYYDINAAALPESETFDFILSTVVFMFLDPDKIPAIIKNMQERTVVGGYNLIVCAMDTEEHPCTMPFPFTFEEGELKNYYSDWELVKYNENLGHLHRLDEYGNPIALQFATLFAKKVK